MCSDFAHVYNTFTTGPNCHKKPSIEISLECHHAFVTATRITIRTYCVLRCNVIRFIRPGSYCSVG